ncbi:wall-associated receptor kinase 2-like [Beta vulgaris subsp. vulgaris]|uniref:wall-associated receptor kinase 2-like n=1 Tax=Beta vulgaris subsp. vulgaris TaxID=3555 RepID=UPI0025487705|nr:wall-associated receptor kinase 2-like [Beta vulgaris subsp. vulgaris]
MCFTIWSISSVIRTWLVLFLAIPAHCSPPKLTMFTAPNTTKPGCPRKCGNLTIPYPFGISLLGGCSRNHLYDIICLDSFDPPKAFLPLANTGPNATMTEILDISETQIRIRTQVAYTCSDSILSPSISGLKYFDIRQEIGCPYAISGTSNKVIAVGCMDSADLSAYRETTSFGLNEVRRSCTANCSWEASNVVAGECDGVGCCMAIIPSGLISYVVSLSPLHSNHSTILSFNPCGYAFLGDPDRFEFRGIPDLNDPDFVNRITAEVPTVLEWVIDHNITCVEAQKHPQSYACQQNTTCVDAVDSGIGGYRCSCRPGYQGNPYFPPGCSDINECEDLTDGPCSRICTNTLGNYTCSCPSGYVGDGRKIGTGCKWPFPLFKIVLGAGVGALLLLIGITWMCLEHKRKRMMELKRKFFEQNGGFILRQLISSSAQDNTEQVKIFTLDELKTSSNNFNEDYVVGRGGYGTVYKGILSFNNELVAVKRSKFMDTSKIEHFINEVVILARIRHPNVVRLIGCCLEVEVPLLVYEFISNGTLYDHLHGRRGASWYSWSGCLRIAIESANALAYLHSIPIIHRDVKSTNILLDDRYTAKVSDFGASRLIPLHHTHLSTFVQGTLGYLDPEYFYSNLLTQKSDVYSFGVVLAELLTRKKPLLLERQTEEKNCNLASYFVEEMQQEKLFEILDPQLVGEASREQLISIAKLVENCLRVEGKDRPTMEELAAELKKLKDYKVQISGH